MSVKNTAPERFQDCLNRILESRGISATQLALLLGYKSKTTLLRVLQGKAGMRCVGNVYRDLCRCRGLQLTESESDRLRVAYEVELWGLDNYRARSEMWRLLYRNNTEKVPMEILCADGQTITLNEFLAGFTDPLSVASLDILLLSGCYPNVMECMADLLEKLDDKARVMQIFMLNGDTARTVRLVRNIMPALGFRNYEAFYISQDEIVPDPVYSGSGTGKAMAMRVAMTDGSVREFQLLMQSEKTGILLEAAGVWKHWCQFVSRYREGAVSLKSHIPQASDYISLLADYAEMERNRTMLIYKEDVCFYFIPTDILLRALTDSLTAGTDAAVLMQQALPKLRSIQEKRFQNIVTKRQPTHWVASASALYRFAETGTQNDHFFAMRPFAKEERLRIFRLLLDQVRENPYFHLYLLLPEEEDSFVPMEASYLEGVGLQLTSNGTDYCLESGWTETVLTEESFCVLYREFFMEELVAHHTREPEETTRVLEEIISMLQ